MINFDIAYLKSQDILKEIILEIKKAYRKAYDNLKSEIEKYLKKFSKEDEKMKKSANSGGISEEQYQEWRSEKIMTGKKYQEILGKLLQILGNIDQYVIQNINDRMSEIYYINGNFTIQTVKEHYKSENISLFNEDAVKKIILENPDLLPKFREKIPKNRDWNRKKLNSAIALGIINGESLDEIAERVAKVAKMNRTSAMRNAATMVTATQNAGRMEGYRRCQSMGIALKHRWLSAEDGHTRASHKAINGEIVEIGEFFSNGLEYPADPRGEPAEIYNCRCCTVAIFEDD